MSKAKLRCTIVPARSPDEILPDYAGTQVEDLLRYHNFGEPLPPTHGRVARLLYGVEDDRLAKVRFD